MRPGTVFGPRGLLAKLTAAEFADYQTFRRKKFSRPEALEAIRRLDLLDGLAKPTRHYPHEAHA